VRETDRDEWQYIDAGQVGSTSAESEGGAAFSNTYPVELATPSEVATPFEADQVESEGCAAFSQGGGPCPIYIYTYHTHKHTHTHTHTHSLYRFECMYILHT
jgi:hypothetical protein